MATGSRHDKVSDAKTGTLKIWHSGDMSMFLGGQLSSYEALLGCIDSPHDSLFMLEAKTGRQFCVRTNSVTGVEWIPDGD